MKQETLNYLQKIDGGDWSTKEMKQKLYDLVGKCVNEFPETELLSVQLGVFAGSTLFPIAHAHKDRKNGMAIGIDAWSAEPCLEGKNHADVDKFWTDMDFNRIFTSFTDRMKMEEWSGFIDFKRGRIDELYKEFEDDSITLLHEDGAHNTQQILKELELWSPKVKVGGYWVISAANWGEAIDGYMKLPKFGFELVQDFEGWEIWRKKGVDKVKEPVNAVEEFNKQVAQPKEIIAPTVSTEKSLIVQTCEESDYNRKQGGMNLAGFNIQPLMIYVPDTDRWAEKFKKGKEHFESVGIKHPIYVPAIYGHGFGIDGTHEYNLDNPTGHHKIGVANTSLFLSLYMIYNIEMNLDTPYTLFLEGDSRFQPDFIDKLTEQLKYVPKDFDWLYIGHCCSNGRRFRHMGGDVYECVYDHAKSSYPVQFPLGGNAYIVAKKALPKIIETQRDAYAPCDLNLALHTLMHLKVYAIRPRLCEQENNPLPI